MKVKLIAILLLFVMALSACGVLPDGDKEGYTGDGPTEEQTQQQEARKEEAIQLVQALWDYDRNAAIREQERQEQLAEENIPIDSPSAEYASLITTQAKDWIRQLLADYPTDAYSDNSANRILKTVMNGITGEELNGGITAKQTSEKLGYWRIVNCSYYNTIFFTDGETNTSRLLFRTNLFHYTMKESEDLTENVDLSELTTENSEIEELTDAFLVVGVDRITAGNLINQTIDTEQVLDTVLMYESYEDAVNSFKEVNNEPEVFHIPARDKMLMVDGYKGKPIVQMPKLVGKFIDIADTKKIKELDDLQITNYEVKWVENDGSLVAYSIVSSSVEEGTMIDITDQSKDARIIVEVAKKAAESSEG